MHSTIAFSGKWQKLCWGKNDVLKSARHTPLSGRRCGVGRVRLYTREHYIVKQPLLYLKDVYKKKKSFWSQSKLCLLHILKSNKKSFKHNHEDTNCHLYHSTVMKLNNVSHFTSGKWARSPAPRAPWVACVCGRQQSPGWSMHMSWR